MKIINVKENVEYQDKAIKYIQSKWANENTLKLYEDCITHSLSTGNSLPIWYLLENEGDIIGCSGLINNDFISRMEI